MGDNLPHRFFIRLLKRKDIGMLNVLDTNFMSWVAKNKATFMLVILLAGNVYQYSVRSSREDTVLEENKKLNQALQDNEQKAIEYERNRSERLEFLLSNLSKSLDARPSSQDTRPLDQKK